MVWRICGLSEGMESYWREVGGGGGGGGCSGGVGWGRVCHSAVSPCVQFVFDDMWGHSNE